MATGRIGVTPTLRTRWSREPAGGTTSLSGLDDNSVSLVYDVGYEQVYRNGVLLSRGNDYTATDGTTITLIDATIAGDIIEVFANQSIPLSDAISRGQFTAKGSLLSATAASTPAVLAVGANDTVLTADSSTATGLKWAALAATKNFSVLGTSNPTTGSSITFSGISLQDILMVQMRPLSTANSSLYSIRFNSDTGTNYVIQRWNGWQGNLFDTGQTNINFGGVGNQLASDYGYFIVYGGATAGEKMVQFFVGGSADYTSHGIGYWDSTSTITSITITTSSSYQAGASFRLLGAA